MANFPTYYFNPFDNRTIDWSKIIPTPQMPNTNEFAGFNTQGSLIGSPLIQYNNTPTTYSELDKPLFNSAVVGNLYDALIKQNRKSTTKKTAQASTTTFTNIINNVLKPDKNKQNTKNKKDTAGGFWVDGKYIPVKAGTPQTTSDMNTALQDAINRLNNFQPQDFINQAQPATVDLDSYFSKINNLNLPDIGKAIMALNEIKAAENQNNSINNFNKGTSIANENNLFNLSRILNNTSNMYRDMLNKEQQLSTNKKIKNLTDSYKTKLANAKNNTTTKTLETLSNLVKNLSAVNSTAPTPQTQATIEGITQRINELLGIKTQKGWTPLNEKDLQNK